MGTFGQILLKNKEEQFILCTTSNGDIEDALEMLVKLPIKISLLDKISHFYLRREFCKIQDLEESLKDFQLFWWTAIEVAHAIVFQHFNRWHIIPEKKLYSDQISKDSGITVDMQNTKLVVIELQSKLDVKRILGEGWWMKYIQISNFKVEVDWTGMYFESLCRICKLT